MNDLEARRLLLADPRHPTPELDAALRSTPALREFRDELLALDEQVRAAATRGPIPHGLADRMVLRSRLPRRSSWGLALAAGLIALAIAIPYHRSMPTPTLELAMIEHVRNGLDEIRDDRGVDPAVLRVSLQGFGVAFKDAGYRIRHLGHCVVAGQTGRHFTLDGPGGVVSFVLLPASPGAAHEDLMQHGDTVAVFERHGAVLVGAMGGAGFRQAELLAILRQVIA